MEIKYKDYIYNNDKQVKSLPICRFLKVELSEISDFSIPIFISAAFIKIIVALKMYLQLPVNFRLVCLQVILHQY